MRTFPCGSCEQAGQLLESCPYCGGTGQITDPGCESLVPNFTSMVRCGADTCNVTRTRCHEHMPPRIPRAPELEMCEGCEQMREYVDEDLLCEECRFERAVSSADALYDRMREEGE